MRQSPSCFGFKWPDPRCRYAHWMDHFGLTSCSLCKDVLPYHSFTTHRRKKHTRTQFKCSFCPKTFDIQYRVTEHEMAG